MINNKREFIHFLKKEKCFKQFFVSIKREMVRLKIANVKTHFKRVGVVELTNRIGKNAVTNAFCWRDYPYPNINWEEIHERWYCKTLEREVRKAKANG